MFHAKSAIHIRPKDFAQQLGVSTGTLRRWERNGHLSSIRTFGNQRRFSPELIHPLSGRRKYIYCRVSSSKQKDDLERQVKHLQQAFPTHDVISDVGSGLNFKRKGLLRMVDEVVRGDVEQIVVSHKDRLCRFAFELIEWLCNKHNTELLVQDQEIRSAAQELSEDLMAIVHVFSCRHHGMRRYAKKRHAVSEDPSPPNSTTSTHHEEVDDGSTEDIQHGPSVGKRQKGTT